MTGALSPLRNRFLNRCAALSVVAASLISCRGDADTASAVDASVVADPVDITVTSTRADLVFTYRDPKTGSFATATSRDEVPADARNAVVVTDLRFTPEQRRSDRYVYVTDLRNPREDGTFPVAVSSRYGFEARVTGTSTLTPSGRREIVIYTTAWCGVCKKAKRLLKGWGVPYVEKDIEASAKSRRELGAKAQRAGVQPGGVPVIDVAGRLLQGLDERQLRDTLRQTGFL